MKKEAQQRPILPIRLDWGDYIIETLAWITFLGVWVMVIGCYSSIPDMIPWHFNAEGKPDDYGTKTGIFIVPVVGSILFLSMTLLNRYPHTFNFPIKITPQNAHKQYSNATKLIRFLKFSMILMLSFITGGTILTAWGKIEGLGIWFLPITVLGILIPIGYFMMKLLQEKE